MNVWAMRLEERDKSTTQQKLVGLKTVFSGMLETVAHYIPFLLQAVEPYPSSPSSNEPAERIP